MTCMVSGFVLGFVCYHLLSSWRGLYRQCCFDHYTMHPKEARR